jgi:DNA-binding XRE family transcriptional regulator
MGFMKNGKPANALIIGGIKIDKVGTIGITSKNGARMPKQLNSSRLPYDMVGWRNRIGVNQTEAAKMLGISPSKLWRAERDRVASLELQWACYGLEQHLYAQKQGRVPK